MRKLEWFLNNFSAGVHSYQSRQPQGDVFAGNMNNVRAGPEGHLRQWSPVVRLEDTFEVKPVTGIAADESRWYRVHDPVLRSIADANGNILADINGVSPAVEFEASFHFRYLDKRVSTGDYQVFGGSSMAGRLSVIGAYRDFVIVGSEGEDRGYWIDMRDSVADDARVLHALGLDPPVLPTASAGGDVNDAGLEAGVYVYAFTNVRAFFGSVDDVALPRQVAQKEFSDADRLFNGMESNPTFLVVRVGGIDGTFSYRGEEITDVVDLQVNNSLSLSEVTYPFEQQTGIYIYRAVGEVTERGDAVASPGFSNGTIADVESLEFRVIDFLWKENPRQGNQPDVVGIVHDAVALNERPLMRMDNDVLPVGSFQLEHYNDLVVCAAGNELRYSEVRFGAPVQWAFPLANSIRIPGRVQFCAEYEGVVIFGGSQGLWRLTGTDEFNFVSDQFSAIGPVSRGAWGRLAKGIGFVSAGGLFVTDGVNVQEVSPGALDRFFEGKQLTDGGVQLLPDGDEIWSVAYDDGTQMQFLRSSKGGWFIGSGINALQSVSISEVDEDGDVSERVLYAGGETLVEEVLWSAVDRVDDAVAWFWESQELDWEAQGQGESLKTFKWLEIASSVDTSVSVSFWVDDGAQLDVFTDVREGFRPVRVPINRRGTRIKFRVAGSGEVRLRGMRLIVEVSDQRRRF